MPNFRLLHVVHDEKGELRGYQTGDEYETWDEAYLAMQLMNEAHGFNAWVRPEEFAVARERQVRE